MTLTLNVECMYDKSDYNSINFRKMCAYRLAKIYKKEEIAHPLVKIQLVEEKCHAYLYRKPTNLPLIDK